MRVPIEIRFRDLDAMRHVNHAAYFTYFEHARFTYWREVLDARAFGDFSFIVVRAECDYRSAADLGDQPEVGIRVSAIGRSSFAFEYEMKDRLTDRVIATGRTVQVMYDYEAGATRAVPDAIRARLREFEPVKPDERT